MHMAAPTPWLNVLNFGAFGDGTTHPITTGPFVGEEMDWLAIKNAIESTQPTGGSIIIPPGTYLIK
jgi:hypothetical protein